MAEIDDGETPEVVAEKIYGDAGAAWVVLLANSIIDPQFEWPLNYTRSEEHTSELQSH